MLFNRKDESLVSRAAGVLEQNEGRTTIHDLNHTLAEQLNYIGNEMNCRRRCSYTYNNCPCVNRHLTSGNIILL